MTAVISCGNPHCTICAAGTVLGIGPSPSYAWSSPPSAYGSITGSWTGSMSALGSWADTVEPDDPLQVVEQDELLHGTKIAHLVFKKDRVTFRGIGYCTEYGTEAYAECSRVEAAPRLPKHDAPDPDCTCGFYIPACDETRYDFTGSLVLLDVEFGGRVIECGHLPGHPRGYRAQWQRVLRVTLNDSCNYSGAGMPDGVRMCTSDRYLVLQGVVASVCCGFHAVLFALPSVSRPVTTLRSALATDIQPGPVRDDQVQPAASGGGEAAAMLTTFLAGLAGDAAVVGLAGRAQIGYASGVGVQVTVLWARNGVNYVTKFITDKAPETQRLADFLDLERPGVKF